MGANEAIISKKVASAAGAEGLPAMIEIGKRAISVPITDASGVAGLIQPRAHVDVLFTKPGSMTEAVTTTILEDVVVLAMGRTTESRLRRSPQPQSAQAAARPDHAGGNAPGDPGAGQKAGTGEKSGENQSFAAQSSGPFEAKDQRATTSERCTRVPPRNRKTAPTARRPRQGVVNRQAVEKKETPAPRHVIDVFRGDKHVQEIFQ